jgi:hypothetical protein
MDEVVRAALFEVSASIVERTPVDTGRARANWVASLNAPVDYTTTHTDRSGGAAIRSAEQVAHDAPGQVFYFVNNLPYARALEYGRSVQAPSGMVRVTLVEFDRAVRNAVRAL